MTTETNSSARVALGCSIRVWVPGCGGVDPALWEDVRRHHAAAIREGVIRPGDCTIRPADTGLVVANAEVRPKLPRFGMPIGVMTFYAGGDGSCLFVQFVYVVPERRRQGVASRMLQQLAEEGAWWGGYDRIAMGINLGNTASETMAQRFGCTPRARLWERPIGKAKPVSDLASRDAAAPEIEDDGHYTAWPPGIGAGALAGGGG